MDFEERISLRPILWAVMHDRTGNAFEDFIHDVMSLCDPSFVGVRTHGKLGDKGSDGLTLSAGKLYACYAPETPNASATIAKLNKDVESAIRQRSGQFTTFVFVHNDSRGIHPDIASELARLAKEHAPLQFELIGMRQIRDMLGRCDVSDVEHILGQRLPLHHASSVGLDEMTELLDLLASSKMVAESAPAPAPVSAEKLSYSRLSPDTRAELLDGIKFSELIEQYYSRRIDVTERDEVAASFNREYRELASKSMDPEDVLLGLRTYLSGTRPVAAPKYRAQTAVLSFFFQTCDIFENAPEGWVPDSVMHA